MVIAALAGADVAHADDACDHAQAVASAQSALDVAPQLFGTAGYLKTSEVDGVGDPVVTSGMRVTAGVAYDLTGLLEGSAKRARARAVCQRHTALTQLQGASTYRGLEARAKVLDAAVGEADQQLGKLAVEVRERVATEQELVAMRLRVDDLRRLAATTRKELAAQPPPAQATAAVATYARADDEIERMDGRLRRLAGIDVTLRGGYDRFLDRDDDKPYFAMVSVSINTGMLFQGGANERAAAARSRLVRDRRTRIDGLDASLAELEAELVAQSQRLEQTTALIADLKAQIATIVKLGGDDGRRYQRTLWFDLVKLEAEHAFAAAQVASLNQVLGK
ncbi:MAG TPA: hypothetical protein VIV11_29000 [Kofleriaceae bacterium]